MSGPLPFDPVERASDSWAKHYPEAGEQVYAAMRAVTSIMRAQQILIAGLDAALRPFGLTFARYEALVLLTFSSRGSLPLGKMGERLQVHPTSVTSIVRRLEAAGLVTRTPHPDDGRAILCEITPEGRDLVERATADLVAADFAVSGLTDEQLKMLWTVLEPLRHNAGDF